MLPVIITPAPSGQAACKICRARIKKGALRLQESEEKSFHANLDVLTTVGHSYHLKCASEQKPREFMTALESFKGEVPNRDKRVATASNVIKQLDEFFESPRWKTNQKGSRFLSGDGWKLSVFSKEKGFNWLMNGDSLTVIASLEGKEKPKAQSSDKGGKDQFGPRNFESAREATDNLCVFLMQSATSGL